MSAPASPALGAGLPSSAELGELLAASCARHRVPGAQLVVRAGGTTAGAAYGVRARETGEEVTHDTVFPVGSLTKPFTAALALALVEDGDVDLEAPLREVLPGFGAGDRVSLAHLLSHTSGLPAGLEEEGAATGRARWLAARTGPETLAYAPGAAFSYSNPGYVVAGALVEEVTGMEWREAVGAVLLDPLGIGPAFATGPGRAGDRPGVRGHVVRRGRDRVVGVAEQSLTALEDPDGGLAMSAGDLLAFAGQFLGDPGAPLAAETAALMCAERLPEGVPGPFGMARGWGLGLARYAAEAGVVSGHDGTLDGVSCHLRLDPAAGTAIALTTNANTGRQVWDELGAALRGRGLPLGGDGVAELAALDPVPLPAGCGGRYRNGSALLDVREEGEGAVLLADGRPAYTLVGRAPGLCTLHEADGGPEVFAGRFLPRGGGPVRAFQYSGRLARRQ